MLAIIILAILFVLIAVRQIGSVRLHIWQIMLGGAVAVLLTGQISPINTLHAINVDVLVFLFGMFVVGQAMEESGYLAHLAYRFFKRAKSVDTLILFILFGFGILSALLMNDTLAIVGTPVVLLLSRKHNIHPTVLLLALAFSVTIGSVMSPIGNPQNLLIALNGNIQNPFLTFLHYLLLPTLINLGLCYILLKLFYKDKFHNGKLVHSQEPIKNQHLAALSRVSLLTIILLILLKIACVSFSLSFDIPLTAIALLACLPILLLSSERFKVVKNIDWHTLLFFASMFIVMESVWDTGFFQGFITSSGINLTSIVMILVVSILLSQLISNVPLVALYLPMLLHAGASTSGMIALAAGSTIAGNFLILGAASNIIIIQNAEKKAKETLSFVEFAKIGIPLTIINAAVYYFFL